MSKKRKILLSLESRATYGYSRNVLRAMKEFPNLEPLTLVSGMHLMPELGSSIELIEQDGFPISAKVELAATDKGKGAWARAMGRAMPGFADALEELDPDIVLLFGDRAETLTLCVTAAYMGIPTAHVQAGDKSGHIDDAARYAIAKLAHIHLASCKDSADRVRNLGEEDFRIFDVGAPQLDDLVGHDYTADTVNINGEDLDLTDPYFLLVQHPVMAESDDVKPQMKEAIEACLSFGQRVFWIYPNSDFGFQGILDLIEEYKANDLIVPISNVDRDTYSTLLANARALVGNSSSGILEAPTFKVPVVNIGNRQRGRQQASNIFNCGYSKEEITSCISSVMNDAEAQALIAKAENPYGDGKSGKRICEILQDIALDRRLLDKITTY